MTDSSSESREAIEAYLHASVLLEQIVPGCVVDDLDGLQRIHYGRPRAGISDEIIAGDADPARVLAILAHYPPTAPTYLSAFTPLDHNLQTVYADAGLRHIVRNTVMLAQLPDVTPFADPTLRRLTEPDELRMLARARGDDALDVDHFTDDVRCYVLDIDGEPVSSAVLIPSSHATAVIEHVLTLAAYRRRGYGRWLLRALHAEAARLGLERTALSSNAAGRPLYDALGYQALCYQDVYIVGQST